MSQWVHPELEKCLCWDEAKNDWCDGYWDQCKNYWESTYGAVAVAAVMAVVLGVFLGVYFTLRVLSCLKCATCCIVRRSMGSGGGVSETAVGTYRKTIASVGVSMVFTIVFLTVLRAGDINTGMKNVNNNLTTMRQNMTVTASTYSSYTAQMAQLVNANVSVWNMLNDQTYSVDKWSDDMENVQSYVVNNGWVVDVMMGAPALFTAILLVLSLLTVRRIVPEIMVLVTMCFAVVVYVIQGTFGVLSVVTPDVCDDYAPVTNVAKSIIHSQLKCNATYDAPLGRMFITTNTLTDLYVNETCVSQEQGLCNGTFTCDACASIKSARAMVVNGSTLVNETARGGCRGQCTIADCAEKCAHGPVRDAARRMTEKAAYAELFNATMVKEVYPLADCSMFVDEIASQQKNICGTFKRQLSPYSICAAVMCVLATIMVVLYGLLNCIYERQYVPIKSTPIPEGAVGIPITSPTNTPSFPSYGTAVKPSVINEHASATTYPVAPEAPPAPTKAAPFEFDPVVKPSPEA